MIPAFTPSVYSSNNVEDIIEINRQSAAAKDGIRIMELGSLSDLIPFDVAEGIRRQLLKRKVAVRQLTNQRVFESWTHLEHFVDRCMEVRFVPSEILPINTEMLLFDDTVAVYQIEPQVSVVIVRNAAFAAQQKALFDSFWQTAKQVPLAEDGSTTYAVTI